MQPSIGCFVETAHGQNRLLTISPAHAGALQSLGRQRLARCFYHAAANGKPPRLIIGVGHALPLVLKVVELGPQQFATSFESLAAHLANQSAKFGDYLVHTAELVSQNNP